MVRRDQIATVIATSLLLGGCAQLNVRVDVLDRDFLLESQGEIILKDQLRAFQDAGSNVVDRDVDRICSTYVQGATDLRTAQMDVLEGLQSCLAIPGDGVVCDTDYQDEAEALRSRLSDGDLAKERAFLDAVVRSQSTLEPVTCPIDQVEAKAELAKLYTQATCLDDGETCTEERKRSAALSYQNKLYALEREASGQLQKIADLSVDGAPPKNAVVTTSMALTQTTLNDAQQELDRATLRRQGIFGPDGSSLIRSELASVAVDANGNLWKKEFNEATGLGIGGSTDVVVRLNSTADFSVKGLVFDGRSTALAVQKLTLSTLQLAAAGTGIPIPVTGAASSGDGSDGDEPAVVNSGLTEAQASLAAKEEEQRTYRASLITLAAQLLRTAENIEDAINAGGADGTVGNKITAERELTSRVFEANKALLQPAGAPSP